MKKLLPIVLLILLQSCQYFEKKVPNEKELLDKQMKEINWNEVDEYPSVADCEKLKDVAQRKQCFFEFFKKQKDELLTLTKEEFYTYTIKIAIYSEKLGLLYKDQKEDAQRTKQEWIDKSYSDYLNSKK